MVLQKGYYGIYFHLILWLEVNLKKNNNQKKTPPTTKHTESWESSVKYLAARTKAAACGGNTDMLLDYSITHSPPEFADYPGRRKSTDEQLNAFFKGENNS